MTLSSADTMPARSTSNGTAYVLFVQSTRRSRDSPPSRAVVQKAIALTDTSTIKESAPK